MSSVYNWIFLSSLIITCLFCISSADDKDKQLEDAAESSRQASKRTRKTGFASTSVRDNIDYRVLAVSLVDEFNSAKPNCSPEELIKTKELGEQASTSFLVECEKQVEHWLEQKTSRLQNIGAMINRWLKIYTFSPSTKLVNFNSLLEEDFSKKLYNTWSTKDKQLYGTVAAESSRRAYYFGDGICNHILAAPFGGVEKLMDVVLRDFQHLNHVKNFVLVPEKIPNSMVVYIIQKQCQKSSNAPQNPFRETIVSTYGMNLIENVGQAIAFVKTHLERIKGDEQTNGYKCDWSVIYSRKQVYNILYRFRDEPSLLKIKADADKSTDLLVENCLLKMQTPDAIDKVYERGGEEVDKLLLQNAADSLRKTIESCDISSDESINNVLEIQSSSPCRKRIIQSINQTIIFKNLELVKIYIDLLSGNLGDFDEGVFREPIYANIASVEYETIEFLTSVFNFKGYKPLKEISSPLLSFYYLYKLSEIFTISRRNESIQPVSKAARNMGKENALESSMQASIQPDIASSSKQNQGNVGQSIDYRRFAINLLDYIISDQASCTPEAFMKTVTDRPTEIERFILRCDKQAGKMLKNKIKRLQNIGETTETMMTIIINIFKGGHADFVSLVEKDFRKLNTFARRHYDVWRKNQSIHGDLARENSKLAYYFGDGICIHIFAPPFDTIEKLMDIVFRDFQHLKFIESFKLKQRKRVPFYLKIYFLQKQCQKFYESPRKIRGKIAISTEGIDSIENAGQAIAFIKTRLESIREYEGTTGYRCDWLTIHSRKQVYNILYRFRDDQSLLEIKAEADKSTNVLVKECLLQIDAASNTAASHKVTDVIYERIKSVERRNSVLEMGNRLKTIIDQYCEVSADVSINNVLDIKSPSSCRNLIIQSITYTVILNTNTELVKLYIDLLSGYLGHLEKGMFREPIYRNSDMVEFKSLEFLTNIFSIKGYKPDPEIENPLINFYYLYKLSEICNICSMKDSTKPWSEVAINLN